MQSGIRGVQLIPLRRFTDSRGWLVEFFRDDTLPEGFSPVQGYLSYTKPGISRGPHEHEAQTDGFAFFDGHYSLHLWENREGEPSIYEVHQVGADNPTFITVPPGVVHAYRNDGDRDAFVLNIPNKLYGGWNRQEKVDEIRHEEDADSRFKL
ncbi:MAG: dTDP-4-dehydrorhamnose 3,5-epimerase family protein [Fimbriimonas sp.]